MKSTPITASVPARPENILPIRLFVSGIATRAGFDINLINDVKTAVSEACVMVISCAAHGEMHLHAQIEDGLAIRIAYEGETKQPDANVNEFSTMIIEAMADDVKIETSEKGISVTMNFVAGD